MIAEIKSGELIQLSDDELQEWQRHQAWLATLCQPQPIHINRRGYGSNPTPPCRHCEQPIDYAAPRRVCPVRTRHCDKRDFNNEALAESNVTTEALL